MIPSPIALASAAGPTAPGSQATAHVRLEWAGRPEGLAALLAVAAALLLLWALAATYRRERPARRRGVRWICWALRVLAVALLGLVMLRPSAARDVERLLPGRVVVMADRSASMSVRDPALDDEAARRWAAALDLADLESVRRLSRHELLRGLLSRGGGALLRGLGRHGQVEVVTFAEDLGTVLRLPYEAASGGNVALPDWQAAGPRTDLAATLLGALSREPGTQLAAVVLLTDGRDTEGGDLAGAAKAAAREGVPLYAVGIGSAVPPRNVAVEEVSAPEQTIRGLPLSLTAFVRAQGFEGRSVDLVLTATDLATGRSEDLPAAPTQLPADGLRQAVRFSYVPPEPGRYRFAARASPLAGEMRAEDNEASADVTVTDEKVKVLLVAGQPSREYRFLSELIRRDPAFDLTVRLYDASAPGAAPTAEDLAKCDVSVFCDPAPEQIGPETAAALADRVDRDGMGLLYLAGAPYAAELLSDPAEGRLRDLLPVVPDAARVRALVGGGGYFEVPRAVELTPEGRGHAISGVAGEAESEAFWRAAPAVYWALPAPSAKPGAAVLLRCRDLLAPEGLVLAAVQPYGTGRVFYCGSPETWRWRRLGISYYERFWLQAVRYCAGGRLAGAERGARISLERRSYALGEAVRVQARLRDAQGAGRAALSVEREGRQVGFVELRPVPEQAGLYEGTFYPEAFGRYELALALPDGTRVTAALQVREPEVEMRDLRLAAEALRALAAGSGGRYLEPDEVSRLPEVIPNRSRVVLEEGPLAPLWDAPWLLALLVGALCAEWALRKWIGLL
jgi:hypothetical protein